jgi:hypothetical protein
VTLGGSVQLQVLEVNTVGNVAQHDGGADINTGLNLVEVDCLGLIPLICTSRTIRSCLLLCLYARCFELAVAAVVELELGSTHTLVVPKDLALMMSVNLPKADEVGCARSS